MEQSRRAEDGAFLGADYKGECVAWIGKKHGVAGGKAWLWQERRADSTTTQWGLVLAGAADFARPASSLSLSQNAALVATGLIWTRWCFVIKPRNLFLASVNFLLFCVGTTQVTRILRYQATLKGDSVGQEAEKAAKEEEITLEKVVKDPKSVVDAVTKGK